MISDTLEKTIERLPAILSVREAADFLSTDRWGTYRLILSGKLPAWKDGEGNWCVARCDLRQFCSKNTNL